MTEHEQARGEKSPAAAAENASPASAMSAVGVESPWLRALRPAALVALIFALWLLQHPYPGIYHDAQLYTIQALARIFPAELANDVFLRWGSQDRFTFFSPVYALTIRMFGTGPAAALLTFLSHAAFAVALWLLARRVLPPRLVWMGVGLVCVIPFTYGARKIFFVMEDFVTARLLAEALVVAGLAGLLAGRYRLAILAGALATLVHPIMALTGLALAVFLEVFSRRQRVVLISLAAIAALAVLVLLAARGTQLVFDEEWGNLIHHGVPYLFPLEWRKVDWARVILIAAVLYAGTRHLPAGPAQTLCRAALIVMAGGMMLSIIGGDLLRVVLITQIQPWRVLWLAAVIALLLSPFIALQLWNGGVLARSALAAILAAFLMADERYALAVAGCAAALVLLSDRIPQGLANLRMVLFGMCALLALAVIINLVSGTIVARGRFDQSIVPGWILALRGVSGTGLLPAIVLCLVGWMIAQGRPVVMAGAAAASVAMALLFAAAIWPQWAYTPFSAASHAAFADWRARVPPGTEVVWFEYPMATWVLLERSNYISQQQTASAVFSRQAAQQLSDRVTPLLPFLAGSNLSMESLATFCDLTNQRFVVSRRQFEVAPIAVASGELPAELRDWKLYACDERATPGTRP
jgi:hypothetical protein